MHQSLFDFIKRDYNYSSKRKNRLQGLPFFSLVFSLVKKDPYQDVINKVIDNVNPSLNSTADPVEGNILDNSGRKNKKTSSSLYLFPYVSFLFLIVFISFLIFVFRAFTLQILKSSEYSLLADKNRIRSYEVPAPRGVIYDRKGNVIAQNQPTFNMVLNIPLCAMGDDLSLCEKTIKEALYTAVPGIQREDLDVILSGLGSAKKSKIDTILLAKNLKKDQVIAVESRGYPAIDVISFPSREYLYSSEFAHLVGYTGLSNSSISPLIEGKTGVEAFYNTELSGLPGKRTIQVNSQNEKIGEFDTQVPVPGKNITLFADLGLQRLSYELLREAVDGVPVTFFADEEIQRNTEYIEGFSKKAKAGVIVAQDPRTGGILALVSYPSFDSQKMVSGITSSELKAMEDSGPFPFFNRAIGALYAPGSTFKLVMGSAILEENIATSTTTIFDKGYIEVAGYTFKNWNLDGHGQVDLLRALQVSNDPYFYIMGGGYENIRGLGIERINKWASRFGFGAKTGIDLVGEVAGFVPNADYKDWYLGDTYITSIGQGDFLATPLQVNLMTSYFANGKELLRPRVVKAIGDLGDSVFTKDVLAKDLVSPSTLATIREGVLRASSPGGTAYPLYDFADKHNGVVAAGKTGTSEYIDSNGEYGTHAVFTAWAPYEEAEIVLTVFLEGGGSGAHDAAPIARKLLDYWFEVEH